MLHTVCGVCGKPLVCEAVTPDKVVPAVYHMACLHVVMQKTREKVQLIYANHGPPAPSQRL